MNEMSKKLPVFTRTISRLLGTGVSSKVFISMIFYLGNYRTHVMIFPGQHTNIIGLQYYSIWGANMTRPILPGQRCGKAVWQWAPRPIYILPYRPIYMYTVYTTPTHLAPHEYLVFTVTQKPYLSYFADRPHFSHC